MFTKKSTLAWLLQVATFVAKELLLGEVASCKLIATVGDRIFLDVSPKLGKDYHMIVRLNDRGVPIHARASSGEELIAEENLYDSEEEFGV